MHSHLINFSLPCRLHDTAAARARKPEPLTMSGLPTRTFCRIALFLQFFQQRIAVIALNFDRTVFHRAARATFLLELFSQLLQSIRVERHTSDNRDAFALAPLGFAPYSHQPIALGTREV